MKVKIKNNKKLKAKSGDIVVLENYFTKKSKKEEYYLIAHNNDFYYLVDIENGEVFIGGICSTDNIDTLIKDMDGKLYLGSKAKLILGDRNA